MRAEDDEWVDYLTLGVGSASTITTYDKPIRLPPRAFPPGFHGANPGPSIDEDPPRPRRRST
jgi:hypothetical protein